MLSRADVKNEVKNLKDVYKGYAEEAAKKPSQEVEIPLLESYDIEFTKDFRNIKKGHKMYGISRVAHDLYNMNGVIKVIKSKPQPEEKDDE